MIKTILFSILSALLAFSVRAADAPPVATEALIQRFGLEQSATAVSERDGWRKPKRILIGGFVVPMLPALKSAAPNVEFVIAKPGDSAAQAATVDAVLGMCTPEIIAAGKSIQWIGLFTAGVEECVSIPALRDRNILVTNMRRIGGPIIAEHVLALTLALTRGLDIYMASQAKGEWTRIPKGAGRTTTVQGKTMLVVGLGGIGSEVAKRAHAMGMRIVATRASGRTGPEFVSYIGLPDELLKLASEADVVVNTAPLTPQTQGIFDAAFFAKMKPSAYFINVARGGSVATDALVAALQNKQIAGAALDVTEPEPPPAGHPLWKAPNLIITPHVAVDSDLGFDVQIAVMQENLRRYVAGERMLSVVDVARGY